MSRRTFLRCAAGIAVGVALGTAAAAGRRRPAVGRDPKTAARRAPRPVTLFLGGDLMGGRGIDQALANPVDPRLYEPWLRDARDYIRLAEARNGPIPRPLEPADCWGDALDVLQRAAPVARIVNLETAVTARGKPWPGKGIHYRMHPGNVGLLQVAGIDACALANNHALDWGRDGLADTLRTLDAAGIAHAGAGRDVDAAAAPAVIDIDSGARLLLFALASPDSGVPPAWAARGGRAGVTLVDTSAVDAAAQMAARIAGFKRHGDIVVVSLHWGGNWGHAVPDGQVRFAHALIDSGMVDLVHGHSAHHPKAIEVYRGRLVLYGCGDLINDYEGIREHADYRGDLGLLYLATLDAAGGRLLGLELVPMQRRRFALRHTADADTQWLLRVLNRESGRFGTRLRVAADGHLQLA